MSSLLCKFYDNRVIHRSWFSLNWRWFTFGYILWWKFVPVFSLEAFLWISAGFVFSHMFGQWFSCSTGVNSGVMLMNLTRLRASTWTKDLADFYREYKLKIPWGDQDLINIYFHYHPGKSPACCSDFLLLFDDCWGLQLSREPSFHAM